MAVVRAAREALEILTYLADQPSPLAAAAIARALGLPRSTTYHLLDTLTRYGFVTHYSDERKYGLGLAAYELGNGYVRQAPLQRLARRPLAALADRCGHNAHFSVLSGRDVLYVIEERAPGRPPLITDVGVRLPAHTTASGRAILSALPRAQVRALYADAHAFSAGNDVKPWSLSALDRLLVDVRREGVSTEDGEVTAGLASIAMPVVEGNGYPVAAVAVTFPQAERTDRLMDRLTGQITSVTRALSQRLIRG